MISNPPFPLSPKGETWALAAPRPRQGYRLRGGAVVEAAGGGGVAYTARRRRVIRVFSGLSAFRWALFRYVVPVEGAAVAGLEGVGV